MTRWTDKKYSYIDVIKLPHEPAREFVEQLTREEIISWLCWNDKHGIYSDEESTKEFGNVMSKEEASEIMLKQIEENRVV